MNPPCHGAPSVVFYPPGKHPDYRPAGRYCAACDLREPCLRAALETDARFGVHGFWAGLAPDERARLVRR